MSIVLKKAQKADLEPIYRLYSKYFGERINFELFIKIHFNYWHSDEDYYGYVLYDNNVAVAFCAYIFVERIINGTKYKFCNFGGWVVEKEYRKQYKTEVLKPLLSMAEDRYTLIGLSPTPNAYKVERELGFEDLEYGKIKFTFNIFKSKLKKIEIISNDSLISDLIQNKHILKIHNDHIVFKGIKRLLLKIDNQEIYIIYKSIKKKRVINMMDILYISDTSLFFEKIDIILTRLFIHLKSFGLFVESRFVPHKQKESKKIFSFVKPHIYLSKDLQPSEIDILYTEKFLVYHLEE